MSKTVTTQIQVTTAGDGETHTDTYTVVNSTGIPPTSVSLPNGVNVTVVAPVGALGALIVSPSGVQTLLKGVAGDNGVVLTAGGIAVIFFGPPLFLGNFVLEQNIVTAVAVTIIWL